MTFDYKNYGLLPSAHQVPLPNGSGPQHIGEILNHQLKKDGQQKALVGNSGSYTYAELDKQVNRACAVFRMLGVERYDRIAACLPNDVDIVVAFLASARIGAIWTGINRPLAGPEKAWLINNAGARVVLADPPYDEEIAVALAAEGFDGQVVVVDRDKPDASEWHCALAAESGDNNMLLEGIDPFEPVAIAYTSGTTGFPKGAVHSHHNLMLPGAMDLANNRYEYPCPQGVMLPLTILNLFVLAPLVAFQAGDCCVCIDGLKPEIIARWVKSEGIGHFASVPTVIYDLLSDESINPDDLATLGHPDIGGAGCPETVQNLYRERFGRGITMAYGMTEAPTIVARTNPEKPPVDDLCGKAVDQIELVVVDESDRMVETGEVGEICVMPRASGPYAHLYTTMLGYWNNAESTQKALSNGMYHTGDLGYFDASGDLYMRGRSKELIIRGGANVYPAEVERVMMEHPAVDAAAVLGVDDDRLGQRVVAAIEVNGQVDTDSLYDFCRERLARYKVPDNIKIVKSLPRNAMNKIVKPKLVDVFS